MKKWLSLLAVVLLFNACKEKETLEPTSLAGRWQLSAVQEMNGKWEDAPPDSPILEILADGTINYTTSDGFKIRGCCSPVPYKAEGDKTILLRFGGEGCELIDCMMIDPSSPEASLSWSVTNVDAQMLSVKTSNGQRQRRYKRID